MKPYIIDVENVRGLAFHGHSVEVSGAMNVRPGTEPRQGVLDSSMHMSLATARELHEYLTKVLQTVNQRSVPPTRPKK